MHISVFFRCYFLFFSNLFQKHNAPQIHVYSIIRCLFTILPLVFEYSNIRFFFNDRGWRLWICGVQTEFTVLGHMAFHFTSNPFPSARSLYQFHLIPLAGTLSIYYNPWDMLYCTLCMWTFWMGIKCS